jgi:dihydroorotase
MLLIRNGRVIDPAQGIDDIFHILVKDGRIKDIQSVAQEVESGKIKDKEPCSGDCQLVDARGLIIVPGLIDIHTHLREPGYEYKETIKTGCEAAAAGGFTSVFCMANTDPVNDNPKVTDFILEKAKKEGCVNVFPVGAVTQGLRGETLTGMGELKKAGVVAISDDGRPLKNIKIARLALECAKNCDLPLISHCEDPNLAGDGVMNEGSVSVDLGLKGIPSAAEETMIARDISLAESTGGILHIAHVSTAGSVRLLREAKRRGIKISAETAPHYFCLTEEAVKEYGTNAKVNPPLRTKVDIEEIKEGLRDGTIDVIATDHAPHSEREKSREFSLAENGMVGLETAVPLSLKLYHEGLLSLMELFRKLTVNPARIFKLDKGKVKVGSDADLTIIGPEAEAVINKWRFKSRGRNTPFDGWRLKGKVVKTVVGGKVIFAG